MTVTSVGAPRSRRFDPLGVNVELPLEGTYHPMGFRLDLATNSREVIEAAEESWSGQTQEFDGASMTMRVLVTAEGPLAEPGTHHKAGALYSDVSDPYNFAHVDLAAQFAAVYVSQKTASDHTWLRWFYVESIPYLMLDQRQVVLVHGGLVARQRSGVLLCGASAAGKSTLAYACARAGWTFLSDDCAALLPGSTDRLALGRPRQIRFRSDAPRLFPELNGYVVRARPTGKLAVEVPTSALDIRTASRTNVEAIVFIERDTGAPSLRPVSADEAFERILADLPTYGGETDAIHEQTVRRLCAAPAYVLQYDALSDAVRLLSALPRYDF
jgi:hypothetical protein